MIDIFISPKSLVNPSAGGAGV